MVVYMADKSFAQAPVVVVGSMVVVGAFGFLESSRQQAIRTTMAKFPFFLSPKLCLFLASQSALLCVYVVAIANKMNKNEPYVYAMNPRKS